MFPNTPCPDCPQCPSEVTPLPLPDLTGLCGDEYNTDCVIYTGPNIDCLNITTGMSFSQILTIFNNSLSNCDCCVELPQNCVLSEWSPWSNCQCYYEGETLICGKQIRTRNIITPPLNGGTPCGSLIETRDCVIEDICFTFGSGQCGTAPDATQVLSQPTGIYNDKVFYALPVCESTLYVWYDNITNLWTVTSVLGVNEEGNQTLDNNMNDFPISNNTTQLWSTGNLISSQYENCPTANICFKVEITSDQLFTYYFNIAPSFTNLSGYPVYEFNVDTPDLTAYDFLIEFNGENWEFKTSKNSNPYVITGILNLPTPTFYPIGTSSQWENTAALDLELISSSYDACVPPPDVDCIWTCTEWSTCNASCVQTRTCVITTPASGNGTCTPSPETQQSCCTPSCKSPLNLEVTIVGSNVVVSFTAVAGAVGYTLTYTSDGVSYTSLTSSLPSFTFPWVCGFTYTGWVVTNCAALNSAQVPFNITIPACPQPELCNGSPLSFISGNVNNPQQVILKVEDSTGAINTAYPVLSGMTPLLNNTQFMTNELAQNGIFLGGIPNVTFTDQFGPYTTGGVVKLKCNSSSPLFFGEVDRTFIGISGSKGFEVLPSSTDSPVIHAIKYHKATNRIYVGGRFDRYKGANCSHNIVCLDANTGTIIPASLFKVGLTGLDYSGAGVPVVYDIQIDESNPSQPKLVICGAFNRYTDSLGNAFDVHNIIRLQMDGTVDTSFIINNSSFSIYQSPRDLSGFILGLSFVKSVYVDNIGDIYAGGSFYNYKGNLANNIVKIKQNGSIAGTGEFDSGTGFQTYNGTYPLGMNTGWYRPYLGKVQQYGPPAQHGISVEKIVPHINGILVTGNFAYYDSNQANALIKLKLDGTRDMSFTIDTTSVLPTALNTAIGRCGYDITVLNDNKVLFGGYLTSYLGSSPSGSRGYYVLNSDGTVNSSYSLSGPSGGFLFIKTIASYFL